MKMTLLQMVQSIMSDMDSDAINSITDTPESLQVASIIRDVYFQYISTIEVPALEELFTLSTATVANYLQLPANIQRIDWVMYDVQKSTDGGVKRYNKIKYLEPDDFVQLTILRTSTDSDVVTIPDPTSGVNLLIKNDQGPMYYTSFDDNYLCFDSYDAGIDTGGMVGSKSLCWGQTIPTWTVADSFTPVLDDNQFPLLLAEAKATCFATIKQVVNPKIEKQARFQRIMTSNDRSRAKQQEEARINGGIRGPNFGRRAAGIFIAGNGTIPFGYRDNTQ